MYFLKISRARAFNSDTNMILLIEIGYIHTGRKDARGKNSKISVVSEVPLGTKKNLLLGPPTLGGGEKMRMEGAF